MMGLAAREVLAQQFVANGWAADTPAAIVCGASTRDEWTWIGTLARIGSAVPPAGIPGVLVVGDVVSIGQTMAGASADAAADEVKYGRS
jgi:siroheme synthase